MPDLRGSDWRARQCKGFVHSELSGAVASRRFQARHIHQTEFLTRSIAYLHCRPARDIYFGGQAAATESEPTPIEIPSHAAIQSRQSVSNSLRAASAACPVAVPPDLRTSASASMPQATRSRARVHIQLATLGKSSQLPGSMGAAREEWTIASVTSNPRPTPSPDKRNSPPHSLLAEMIK